MKKILLVLSIAVFIASCTKKSDSATSNYTCDCVVNDGTTSDTSHIPESNVSHSAAQSDCNHQQTIFTAGNVGSTVSCTLK